MTQLFPYRSNLGHQTFTLLSPMGCYGAPSLKPTQLWGSASQPQWLNDHVVYFLRWFLFNPPEPRPIPRNVYCQALSPEDEAQGFQVFARKARKEG